MALLFKIWTADRSKKTFVPLNDNGDGHLYEKLVLKASEKLEIDGCQLVLESDGTIIDEDEVIKLLNKETFILLSKNEKWMPESLAISSVSLASTVTVDSDRSTPLSDTSFSCSSISDKIEEVLPNYEDRVSEYMWSNFKVPWEKLSNITLQNCQSGKRNKESITEVIHCVVNSMREIKTYIPTHALKTIAGIIVRKFPDMFLDKDEENVVIGEGYYSIFNKLQERNNYLNRPHKRKSSLHLNASPKQIKLRLTSKAGCSNWQPDTQPDMEPNTLDEKKEALRLIAEAEPFIFDKKVETLLHETYTMQRFFLNNPNTPSILTIKKEWPILLHSEAVSCHYEELMGHSINDLRTCFNIKTRKILEFGLSKKLINEIPENPTDRYLYVFKVLGNFFGENYKILISTLNKGETGETIESLAKSGPLFPHIVIITGENTHYVILIEMQQVCQFQDFMESFTCLFAMYYNFNMAYPKGTSCILEFIQRYMLKIHPDQGSKNKKSKSTKLKMLSLMNKLRDIDA